MNHKVVCFASTHEEWPTPLEFFKQLNDVYNFTLDPCCTHTSAKAPTFFTKKQNGLIQDWGKHVVWMNPPYGRGIENWMRKALVASKKGATVVCLVPSRTDTNWWHRYAMKGKIFFVKGRLKFGGSECAAPFSSSIVVFSPL